MNNQYCPNYEACILVNQPGFTGNELKRQRYMADYCHENKTQWESCKRYIVKSAINFCPDFVVPDTSLSVEEIIDRFDIENEEEPQNFK